MALALRYFLAISVTFAFYNVVLSAAVALSLVSVCAFVLPHVAVAFTIRGMLATHTQLSRRTC